jgi:hypothetical protein
MERDADGTALPFSLFSASVSHAKPQSRKKIHARKFQVHFLPPAARFHAPIRLRFFPFCG